MANSLRMVCPLHRHAQARPNTLSVWAPDRRWTYAELDAAVEATCARLREHGITSGNRIAFRLHRGPDVILLFWALWRMGAVAVPLSTRLPPAEARRAAQRVGAARLITRDSTLLSSSEGPLVTAPPNQFVEKGGRGDPAPSLQRIDRPATIVFTSGSTGEPKAILHSWANHLYSAKGSNANIPLRSGDRWLVSLPLYHVGGLAILVRSALVGGAVALADPDSSVSRALHQTGATHTSLVATQFGRLLEATDGDPSPRLRAVLLGGGPVPDSLLRQGYNRNWPLHTSYGSTEMASQITTTAPGAPLEELRTAGRSLPHRRIRVEDGQILVSGPTLCTGIVTDQEIRDLRVNGWYPTGDLGRLDASRQLHVRGRIDRQFVSGGENIHPKQIEVSLEELVGVEQAVVVSVADEEFGRRPVGFVRTEMKRIPEQWERILEATLPDYMIPDALFRLPEAAVQKGLKIDHEFLRRKARGAMDEKRGASSVEE